MQREDQANVLRVGYAYEAAVPCRQPRPALAGAR